MVGFFFQAVIKVYFVKVYVFAGEQLEGKKNFSVEKLAKKIRFFFLEDCIDGSVFNENMAFVDQKSVGTRCATGQQGLPKS